MDNQYLPITKEQYQMTNTSGFQNYLRELGLPYENILASDQEKAMLQVSLPMVMQTIPEKSKKDATISQNL